MSALEHPSDSNQAAAPLPPPLLPHEALIVERIEESPTIFTLRLRFTDPLIHQRYQFAPGQFNMLYLYGIGEVAISIVSDPTDDTLYDHTIRAVGRVTRALQQLVTGDTIGVRGPYGRGWPVDRAQGDDLLIVTGGLGCAPVVSVINYVMRRRQHYGRLIIMQGVRHANDLIWRERYEAWAKLPETQVLIAADQGGRGWPWHTGQVTALFERVALQPERTTVMMCGPEGMMRAVATDLTGRGIAPARLYLSMERNMKCGVGHCGHCQFGSRFVCRQGPVFSLPEVEPLLGVAGF